jgi:putative membrane protein
LHYFGKNIKMAHIRFFAVALIAAFGLLSFRARHSFESTRPTGPDSSFLKTASQSNLAEIAAGKLAAASGSDRVKKIGQMMVQDHSTAQAELVTLAKNENVDIPMEPDTEHKSALDSLSKLSGPAFDSAYLQSQVADHRVAVGLFEQESSQGGDNSAKAYALKYLPKLKKHLSMVRLSNDATGSGMGM